MHRFSQQLRERAKSHFAKLYNRDVSDDEAEEWLKSLARLYDFFLKASR